MNSAGRAADLRRQRDELLAEYRRAQREYSTARRTSDREAMEDATARAVELAAELHSVEQQLSGQRK